jgi:hypothetical protein
MLFFAIQDSALTSASHSSATVTRSLAFASRTCCTTMLTMCSSKSFLSCCKDSSRSAKPLVRSLYSDSMPDIVSSWRLTVPFASSRSAFVFSSFFLSFSMATSGGSSGPGEGGSGTKKRC